jgi:hypothetical protein
MHATISILQKKKKKKKEGKILFCKQWNKQKLHERTMLGPTN